MSSKFKINSVEFSSVHAAIQCIALVWNVGHLPGTFSVEKGIYRFLYSRDSREPASIINWPYESFSDVQKMKKKANQFLLEEDYLGASRVLAVVKLLSLSKGSEDHFFKYICSFLAPFLLVYNEGPSKQWPKLRTTFKIVRHLAYLTLDAPFSGLQWGPSIPAFVEHLINSKKYGLDEFADIVSEILSPFERLTYSSVYHSDEARKEVSVIAERVYN